MLSCAAIGLLVSRQATHVANPQGVARRRRRRKHSKNRVFCCVIFTPNRQVRRGISLERFTSETLRGSEGSFRQKTRLSLLSIPVWLRCRQQGLPIGLPSVALPESTPRCSRCLYALWATGTALRAARRVGLRGAPQRVRRCVPLEQTCNK